MHLQLEYRGFSGSASFNVQTGRHEGILIGVADRVFYEAPTVESLIANFEAAVDEYIEFLHVLYDNDLDEARIEAQFVNVVVRSAA